MQPNLDLLPLIVNLPDFNHFLELGQVAGNLLTPNKDRLHLLTGKGGVGIVLGMGDFFNRFILALRRTITED